MNANNSISSTGRPNSRRREVFIFSPLNFAHWGEVYDETTAADETGKNYVYPKKFLNQNYHQSRHKILLLFSESQYSDAMMTPKHVCDRRERTTHAKKTASTRENVLKNK